MEKQLSNTVQKLKEQLQSKEREIDILEQENQSIETKIIHATPRIPNKMDRK